MPAPRLVLGSASPRRLELLAQLGVEALDVVVEGCRNRVPFGYLVDFYEGRLRTGLTINERPPVDIDRLKLSTREMRVLNHLKKQNNLADLLDSFPSTQKSRVYRIVYLMDQLNVVEFRKEVGGVDPLVMVVDGDGERLLGAVLSDDVLVESRLDVVRGEVTLSCGGAARAAGGAALLVGSQVAADDARRVVDAAVADIYVRPRNHGGNLVGGTAAERAADGIFAAVIAHEFGRTGE